MAGRSNHRRGAAPRARHEAVRSPRPRAGARERRLALKHCDERGTPRDACPAPADHTSAGVAVGFLLDVALVAGAAYMLTPEPGPGLTLTATDRDVPLAE